MNDRDPVWDALRAEWTLAADDASIAATAKRQLRAARLGALRGQLIEALVAGAALLFVGLALHHAASVLHAALGIVVGAAICGLWLWRRELARQEQRALESSAADHAALMRVVRRREARAASFIQAVIVLELAFLIPWWIRGSRIHSRRLSDVGSVETVWLPLVGMVLLFGWAIRARVRANRELP